MKRNRVLKVSAITATVLAVTLGALAVFVLPRFHASAQPGVVTRGDAQAIFNTVFNGCGANLVHGSLHDGQPCEGLQRAQVLLFAPTIHHYCVDDWHAISVRLIDTRAHIEQFDVTIVIDGQLLATTRTPIKPVNPTYAQQQGFSPEESYWINTGTVVPPSALAVGTHTSHVETVSPTVVFDTTFEVDPSGTGVCLSS
jgi:hypothetical protein